MNASHDPTPALWWLGALLLALVAACGTRLIRDPSFELWCDDKLCAPWESKGAIARVGTWHARDYGVSLMDGAEISQRSDEDPVECIEFELIADVAAEAEVQLELDFMDDGSSEYEQSIAESHWARLRFLVKAPSWYRGLRFRVRKRGTGRAVIAQLSAVSSSDCKGDPVKLDRRPDGAHCERDAQCASGVCDLAPQRFGLAEEPPSTDARVCGGCSAETACPTGQVCGVRESDFGPYRECIQPSSSELGAFCESDAECASGHCTRALHFNNATCAECTSDAECAEGEVCGVEVLAGGATRVCEANEPAPLGELCGGNDQCQSGVCCFGACSECCGEFFECEGGAECGTSELGPGALLCAPGGGERARGDACRSGSDCRSGRCELPANECLLPGDEDSPDFLEAACRVARQLAGVCR